ncbi:MAG: phage tail sheath C-terminal domain-containing protein [Gemmatimonadota bacterium]
MTWTLVEETSFPLRSIEGASTTTAAFIGPARYGPVDLEPEIITSLGEFERIYGDPDPLAYGGPPMSNYNWHAARAFFAEGGKRLYLSRVFRPLGSDESDKAADGHASAKLGGIVFRARYPGAFGTFTLRLTAKVAFGLGAEPGPGDRLGSVRLALEVLDARDNSLGTWTDLVLEPTDPTGAVPGSLFAVFGAGPETRAVPIVATAEPGMSSLELLALLFAGSDGITDDIHAGHRLVLGVTRDIRLTGGNDGLRPGAREYEGSDDADGRHLTGLKRLEAQDDISIVAAPGSTWDYDGDYRADADAIIRLLLAHASTMRYRIAVIDSAPNQPIAEIRAMRAALDSSHGAIYYPWVQVVDPVSHRPIALPPSGFVAGIFVRNDLNRGVSKAPANEVVNLASGLQTRLSKPEQALLNAEDINCFRHFRRRGTLLWGARTLSRDSEWKYVNVGRYFAYLEQSIDRGTQWVVFEPNGENLWANVRRTIEDFLLNEWQSGAILGNKPDNAFFVRCDRTTMTQDDLDNGRLVCVIGVAPLKPAEFVIFRIGQWTVDHKP